MNTQNLADFGAREREEAGDLLKAYQSSNDDTRFFAGEGVTVEFNPNSGMVFLVDSDFNVAMMNGDKLEDFFSCPYCGHEGFLEEMYHEDSEECAEYLDQINE